MEELAFGVFEYLYIVLCVLRKRFSREFVPEIAELEDDL